MMQNFPRKGIGGLRRSSTNPGTKHQQLVAAMDAWPSEWLTSTYNLKLQVVNSTTMVKIGADDSARAKFDNPIRSNYHAPARSSSCEGHRSLPDVKKTVVLSTTVKV
ncbi:hypothetical protein BHE74_00036825 [Ensete ventricosum]|nr:hypothetical protein BHE74_00036825 [Ensete ventricosum]